MSDENTIIHVLVPPAHAHSHSTSLVNALSQTNLTVLWLDTLGDSIRHPQIHHALTFDLPALTDTLQHSSDLAWDILVIDNIAPLFTPLLSSTQGHAVMVDFMRLIQRLQPMERRIIMLNTSHSLAVNPTFNLLIDASLRISEGQEKPERGNAYIVQKASMHPPGPLTRPLWEL